jgi:hypothetical protein
MKRLLSFFIIVIIGISCSSENVQELQDPCDSADVVFKQDVEALLSANCTDAGCHNGPNGVGGLDLNTYASAKEIADNGKLMNRITGAGNLMPPSGKLPKCDIERIRTWVEQGAPNN